MFCLLCFGFVCFLLGTAYCDECFSFETDRSTFQVTGQTNFTLNFRIAYNNDCAHEERTFVTLVDIITNTSGRIRARCTYFLDGTNAQELYCKAAASPCVCTSGTYSYSFTDHAQAFQQWRLEGKLSNGATFYKTINFTVGLVETTTSPTVFDTTVVTRFKTDETTNYANFTQATVLPTTDKANSVPDTNKEIIIAGGIIASLVLIIIIIVIFALCRLRSKFKGNSATEPNIAPPAPHQMRTVPDTERIAEAVLDLILRHHGGGLQERHRRHSLPSFLDNHYEEIPGDRVPSVLGSENRRPASDPNSGGSWGSVRTSYSDGGTPMNRLFTIPASQRMLPPPPLPPRFNIIPTKAAARMMQHPQPLPEDYLNPRLSKREAAEFDSATADADGFAQTQLTALELCSGHAAWHWAGLHDERKVPMTIFPVPAPRNRPPRLPLMPPSPISAQASGMASYGPQDDSSVTFPEVEEHLSSPSWDQREAARICAAAAAARWQRSPDIQPHSRQPDTTHYSNLPTSPVWNDLNSGGLTSNFMLHTPQPSLQLSELPPLPPMPMFNAMPGAAASYNLGSDASVLPAPHQAALGDEYVPMSRSERVPITRNDDDEYMPMSRNDVNTGMTSRQGDSAERHYQNVD